MPDAACAATAASAPIATLPSRGTLLGFDFGLARIGIATAELETGLASALDTIHETASDARFAAIGALIGQWQPVALVVGVPTQLDGSDQELSARCRRFANQLHGRFGLPVFTVDERLSSLAAERELVEAGMRDWRKRKAVVDAAAARLILQTFLDGFHHATSRR